MKSFKSKTFVIGIVFCLLSSIVWAVLPAPEPAIPEFNKIVLDVLKQYPTDGTHGYWWPRSGEGSYDGCTEDLYLMGKKVMSGESQKRTYCCGMTAEVFLKAYKIWLEHHPSEETPKLTPENYRRFLGLWFVKEHNGPGPSAALEEYQLGRTIPASEALPGDFIQIWRTPNSSGKETGHSVIFLDWVKDEKGTITGIKYWSTQPKTNGIGERIEYYGPDGGICENTTFFGRVEIAANAPKVDAPKQE